MARESPPFGGSGRLPPLPPADPAAPAARGYTLVRRIGAGSYGEVWLGYDSVSRWCAVKIIRRDAFESDEPYRREFRGLAAYVPVSDEQPDLLRIFHAEGKDDEGCFYYAMELADDARSANRRVGKRENAKAAAGDLVRPHDPPPQAGPLPLGGGEGVQTAASVIPTTSRAAVAPQHDGDWNWGDYTPHTLKMDLGGRQPLPSARCLEITRKIATALGHLHARGLVHRDVKPSNIVFVRDEPKLADIGLVARTEQALSVSQVGAPGYMPEEGAGTPQGDLYALGKVLYEMATGYGVDRFRVLPSPEEAGKHHRGILELNRVILKACATQPKERYQSAKEMLQDLEYLEEGSSLRARRRLALALRAAVAVGALLVAALVVQHFRARITSARERAELMAHEQTLRADQALAEKQRLSMLFRAHQVRSQKPAKRGWRGKVWEDLKRAAEVRVDDELRGQAAASLSGLDAHLVTNVMNFAGSGLAFAPGGEQLLISASASNHTCLWDATKAALVDLGHTNRGPVGVRADGTAVQLTVQGPTNALLIEAHSGNTLMRFEAPPDVAGVVENPDLCLPLLAMTPNGSKVAAVLLLTNGGRVVVVWDAARPQPQWRLTNDQTTCLSLSPDGQCIGVGEQLGNVSVWSLPEGRRIAAIPGDGTKVQSIAFVHSPERRRQETGEKANLLMAVGTDSGGLTIWDVRRQVPRSQCHGSYYDIYALAFSPDGMMLASAGRQSVRLWDVATGRQLLETEEIDQVAALAFASDGTRLAACSARAAWIPAQLKLWELDPGRGVRTLHGLTASIEKVALSHDSRMGAALSLNWEVAVWDLAANRLLYILKVLPGPSADNAALVFSPDDAQLVFAAGSELSVWDMTTGRLLKRYDLPPGLQDRPVFDRSGRLLLCRGETIDNVPPHGLYKASEHPRVCRIRDLSRTDWKTPLVEITNFNERVHQILTPPDGRLFFIEGYQQVEGERRHFLSAFDAMTGGELWAYPKTGPADSVVCLDRCGQFAVFNTNDTNLSIVVELDSGRWVDVLGHRPNALSPQGTNWFATAVGGMALFSKGGTNALLTVGIDVQHTDRPQFDSAWNLMLWGHVDGTVSVYDLGAMRRQLNEFGAGW